MDNLAAHINLYCCNLLIHVVSKIIVRSVKYHIYVERLYIKKRKKTKGKATLCSTAQEYKVAGKAACEPTVECLVQSIWSITIGSEARQRLQDWGRAKVEDGHRDKTEHNDLLPVITSKVTPLKKKIKKNLRTEQEHVLKTQV